MDLVGYIWALPLLPLATFGLALVTGRRLPSRLISGIAISVATLAAAWSGVAFVTAWGGRVLDVSIPWLQIGSGVVDVGVRLDALSATMLVVVTSVSLLVQVYSVSYMSGDERYRWFFAAISLFTAAMLGVVLSNGWLMMYMCWEVMGLASYLLIGFWYESAEAPDAAIKAFLVTRFGDVGFALALVIVWLSVGSFTFEAVFAAVESGGWAGPTLTAAALLFLLGAMGKSAQFPLHVWLPDAMAGPTPGSALIHAATMVAAGVYLVARSFPLFESNAATLVIVAWIGAITALLGALVALAQNDIKKVLAYSTISQLGYMFLALGAGSSVAAMFHLTTHAFFKALLFLAAGSVIHATHTQDLHELGGLWRRMPWTTATWVIGALSLSGIPPLSGFWSKDEILLATLHADQPILLAIGLLTAALTAYYMARTTFLAFFVAPSPESHSHHAHESDARMVVPLVVLAGATLVVGFANSPMSHFAFAGFLGGHEAGEPNLLLAAVAVGIALASIALAYASYVRRWFEPDAYFRTTFVSVVLSKRFWIDEAYERIVIDSAMYLSEQLRRLDQAVVDGSVRAIGWIGLATSAGLDRFDRAGVDGAVDGLGWSVDNAGEVRRIHTGNVQTYLVALVIGVVVLVVVFAL